MKAGIPHVDMSACPHVGCLLVAENQGVAGSQKSVLKCIDKLCRLMMFEWDETKRQANLGKHKLDFVDARLLFDGRPTITARSDHPIEARFVTTAMIDGRFYTVVWTWRDDTHRIISFRRARDGETRAYHQAHG